MITLKLSADQTRNVTGGHIVLPRTGIWVADLKVDERDELPDHLTMVLGGIEMPAAVHKAELVGGMTDVRLVGGAGGIGENARPKHYHRPLVRHIVADLLRDSGEKLSTTSSADILGTELEAWDTMDAPTGSMLAAICAVVGNGANWRVLADGTVWIGVEAWPDSGIDSRTITLDGANAASVVGTDLPTLLPGTLLDGRRVDTVQHDLANDRTAVMFAAADDADTDRTASAWGSMQAAQDPMGLYASMYRAKVLAQNGDADFVDVRPEDPRLPDMMKIPLRHGVPGLRVQVEIGSYLLIGWDDGQPNKPFAALWNRDTHAVRVSLVADQLNLGSRTATEAFIHGTSYRAAEDKLFAGLQQAFSLLAPLCSPVGPFGPLGPGVAQAIAALTAFQAQAAASGGFLSPQVRGA